MRLQARSSIFVEFGNALPRLVVARRQTVELDGDGVGLDLKEQPVGGRQRLQQPRSQSAEIRADPQPIAEQIASRLEGLILVVLPSIPATPARAAWTVRACAAWAAWTVRAAWTARAGSRAAGGAETATHLLLGVVDRLGDESVLVIACLGSNCQWPVNAGWRAGGCSHRNSAPAEAAASPSRRPAAPGACASPTRARFGWA